MDDRFVSAEHTVVISDLHITDAQVPLPQRPLWKRYKQRDLFIDPVFDRFLQWLDTELPPDSELVLNGDVFDFDSVMAMPLRPVFPVSWLERRRGLNAEEAKSRFKMRRIIEDHPVFIAALRRWVLAGHRLIIIVGNHDIELQWHSVRRDLLDALDLPAQARSAVRVCEWFYISNRDTLIEHGNQYDSYCLCADPVHPTIRWGDTVRVRVPFGNLAERYLLNGMGLFNPHVEGSFIKSGPEYVSFFFKYMLRIQPWVGWSWLWGALVTLVVSLREGFRQPLRDPRHVEQRMADIAHRANARPAQARALLATHVHPAIFSPWRIMRELWLDRAAILALLVWASFQVFTVLNVFEPISPWWWGFVFLVLLPPFVLYARSVRSETERAQNSLLSHISTATAVVGVGRAVVGHTHIEHHLQLDTCELLNTGTWSPAFRDVECTVPFGRDCFAWIRPGEDGQREAALCEWQDPGVQRIPVTHPAKKPTPWRSAARRAREAIRKA